MTFTESVKTCLGSQYFFKFQGRASRSEYWWFMLFNFLVNCGSILFFILPYSIAIILSLILSLGLLPANVGVTIRRLHDRNLSGWWIMGPIILAFFSGLTIETSIVATILSFGICVGYLVIFLMPSQAGPNRYGPMPE